MATSTQTISVETRARPDDVFVRLGELARLSTWLPRSPVYRGTTVVAASGGAYVDHTALGDLVGRVESAVRPERIEFVQATEDGALSIRIVYAITPTGTGARIARTGTITTAGRLRWLHPIIVAATRRENRRTMTRLRTVLDNHWREIAAPGKEES